MTPYLLSLILVTLAGEPTQIVEIKKDFAECHEALGVVTKALANANRVIEGKCTAVRKEQSDDAGR